MTALLCAAAQGRKHSSPSPPLLPSCPALLCCEPGPGDGAWTPSRGCQAHPKNPRTNSLSFCRVVALEHHCLLPKSVCSSRWETAPNSLESPQRASFLFSHSVILFELGDFSDLAPQRAGWQQGWEKAGNSWWEPGTGDTPAWPCRNDFQERNAAPLLHAREGIPQHSPSSGCRAILGSPCKWEVKEEQ